MAENCTETHARQILDAAISLPRGFPECHRHQHHRDDEPMRWTSKHDSDDADMPNLANPGPVVICGPSGVGKSTLIKRLQKEHPDIFRLAVSHTTRPPRENEKDGEDYYFVDAETFEKTDFLEWSTFAGCSYGTAKDEINRDSATRCVILDLNFEGVLSIKKSGIRADYVLILPQSREELERRIKERGPISEESLEKRLCEADDLEDKCHDFGWHLLIVSGSKESDYHKFEKFFITK